MSDKTLLMAEAMNYLDDAFIEEAHCEARGVTVDPIHRRKTISRIALVACLCLVAIGVARLPAMIHDMSASGEAAPMEPEDGNSFGDQVGGNSENNAPMEDAPPSSESKPETGAESEMETGT